MMKKLLPIVAISGMMATMTSCDKDDNESIPPYTVPATYTFDNVEYKESAARVSMWFGYTGLLGKSNVRQLSQDTINNLWNNVNKSFTAETAAGIPYTYDVLNNLTYNLAGKTADAAAFKALADSNVKLSQYYNTPASKGVAGKIGNRLVSYKGLEFNQAVAKGTMGAFVMSNVFSLLDKTTTDDNKAVNAGTGTAMQHNWDLAFGYVGIPKDYDSGKAYTAAANVDRPLAIGGYFGERGKFIKSGGTVYEAFRKGRAAIGVKDYAVRDAAIATIKEYLEKTIAAAAYYYFNAAQSQTNLADKFHGLSEGYGFILALKYRATNKLTPANYQTLVELANTDFYALAEDASNTKIKQVLSIFTTAYGQLQP